MRLGLSVTIVGVLATASRADPPQWQKDWSKKQLSIADAEAFCKKQGKGWRLPTQAELKSMLVDPEAAESELRKDAPGLPQDGYLWSGEDVSASRKGQRWIMNLANGHIFNGDGRTGYAKCLKGAPAVEPEVSLSAPVTSIGAPDAKLVIPVAMQPDYPWFKVRPVLDKLAADHPVRFELHFYLTDRERYLGPSIALCAAAKQGKFGDVEHRLSIAKPDAAAPLEGIDDATMKACRASIDNDHKALQNKGIEGVPVFWIGKQTVYGAQPIATFEAAIKAAGG